MQQVQKYYTYDIFILLLRIGPLNFFQSTGCSRKAEEHHLEESALSFIPFALYLQRDKRNKNKGQKNSNGELSLLQQTLFSALLRSFQLPQVIAILTRSLIYILESNKYILCQCIRLFSYRFCISLFQNLWHLQAVGLGKTIFLLLQLLCFVFQMSELSYGEKKKLGYKL